MPDRVDIRDWPYQPRLAALPDAVINIDRVPFILDQEREGACTGFALAAVINFLLAQRLPPGSAGLERSVSPRMLYEMARRYDEWPGEDYEGSSARGGMQGWVRHGVCFEDAWPIDRKGAGQFTQEIARLARRVPGGAFYRVTHREVRDMHSAISEVGIIYCTLMVHDGWFDPGPRQATVTYESGGQQRTMALPVIERRGRASSGHAVAFVGYTDEGFIVQNSWNRTWGAGGFALLPYEDYLLHATDVWVAQIGVPLALDLWENGYADTKQGMARAAPSIPLAQIRPYVVDVANNGELSTRGDYWTTEEDIQRLFTEEIPGRAGEWERRRVMLYLHGGLNNEDAAARRIIAFKDVFLENQIYPLHIMWESGAVDAVRDIIEDILKKEDDRAGGAADWMRRFREGLTEAKDLSLELTAAGPGGALWREMKENARLSSSHPEGRGAMQIMAREVTAALGSAAKAARAGWELHVVAHSAGAIYAAYAMEHFLQSGIRLASFHLMAPAVTVDLFNRLIRPHIEAGKCPVPDLYVLSEQGELDDDVGPYGKSLLYLVSNAFEPSRSTPLLGMQKYIQKIKDGPQVDPALQALLAPTTVVAGAKPPPGLGVSRSNSHGGFDNDKDTLNSILGRILGGKPRREFDTRDLQC